MNTMLGLAGLLATGSAAMEHMEHPSTIRLMQISSFIGCFLVRMLSLREAVLFIVYRKVCKDLG